MAKIIYLLEIHTGNKNNYTCPETSTEKKLNVYFKI